MIMESLLNGRIFGNPLHLHKYIQPDGPDPYLTPGTLLQPDPNCTASIGHPSPQQKMNM